MADLNKTISRVEALEKAKQAEADGNLEDAAGYYEMLIKDASIDQLPFDRLMIIYRKLKKYKDELRIINRGLKIFGDFYKKPTARKSAKQQKLTSLSNAFMKSTGLNDKKGNPVYLPEPLPRWLKRKTIVEKKI